MLHLEKEETMRFKKIVAVAMAAVMSMGGVCGGTAMSATSVKASSFTDLNQDEIVDAMGAGWNLGNQLEASIGGVPYETAWGNPTITESLIKAVKEAGFSTIRVPVSYLSHIGSGSSYTIDDAWLDRVQEVVDMCIDNDLYVIINMHGDGYHTVDGGWLFCDGSEQTTIQAKYKACWNQIATRFASYDEHLIFESMNEEFDGTYGTPNRTYYSNINELNQIFVDTVRQSGGNNSKRWLLVPGWNTNIEYTAGDYGFEIPSDNYLSSSVPSGEKRIMISVHYYDPWDFCGTESSAITQWGSVATDSSKVASYGNETYLNSQFYNLYSAFTSKGYPVVIGEYGAIDKSEYDSNNAASREEFAKKVCEYAEKYECVPVWWDNGHNGTYGFALFDRSTCKVTQQGIIDAIMSVCENDSEESDTPATTGTTVLFSNGSSDETYSTSDATWLVNASDDAVITLKYTCMDSSHSYWGVLGWGASVDGNWVNGNSYNAAATATDTVEVTFTAKELKDSLGVTSGSNVGYLALNAYNGGKIISLSITDSSDAEVETEEATEAETEKATEESTEAETEKETEKVTEKVTEAETEKAASVLELNANDLKSGTYTSDYVVGDFTIGASSSKYISVESASFTLDGNTFSKRLKMNGGGNSTGRYIKFTTDGAATIEIIGASTTAGKTRTIRLAKDSVGGTKIGDITVAYDAEKQTFNVDEEGTYYIYSTSSGIYVYDVKVTTTSSSDVEVEAEENETEPETEAATEEAKTGISLLANDLTTGTYTSTFSVGSFTIGASSSKSVQVKSAAVTVDGTTFKKSLVFGGGGNSTGRYIKFTTTGACTVKVVGSSTSASATRTIRLAKNSVGGTTVADNNVTGTAATLTYKISEAGTYYLYSTGSGVNVYSVNVEY